MYKGTKKSKYDEINNYKKTILPNATPRSRSANIKAEMRPGTLIQVINAKLNVEHLSHDGPLQFPEL